MALRELYRHSLALLTDLYQLTMAYGYWRLGRADERAVFQLYFRRNPFGGGYTVAAGLGEVVEYLRDFRFDKGDLAYLRTLKGNDGKPLFDPAYVDYLGAMQFACDVDAIPEGTVVFPNEPLVRVTGPILQAQILETALLNIVNFQTLVATKASRVCRATGGEPVTEFGLRRAQGVDGGLAAARAAYVGGVHATSNVLAGKLFGIPVKGTHAHSWVMSFDTEPEAFDAYASAMPNNCVFLVDTYNTLEGVRRAVAVGRRLRDAGHEMVGIRLDSGDLAYLSIEARKILDAGGFPNATILASNDLDETIITSLKAQGARVGSWGVGTKLVTAYDQPALGGVYKLAAIEKNGAWEYKVKLSEQLVKVSTPGVLQVRRYFRGGGSEEGEAMADMIYNEHATPPAGSDVTIVDPADLTRRRPVAGGTRYEELLVPVFRAGACVYDVPALAESRRRTGEQLARFHPTILRFLNPHEYVVGLERGLHEMKTRLVMKARGIEGDEG